MSYKQITTGRGKVTDDGRQARYCTVDDPLTGSGTGLVELMEKGTVVTVFNQICTDFTERRIGDDESLSVEAYTSEIDQITGKVQSQDPAVDVQIVHVLFLLNTVKVAGGIPTGTVLFMSPPIPFIRICGVQAYKPQSPGFVHGKLGGEVLRRADPIGLLHLSWRYGRLCYS